MRFIIKNYKYRNNKNNTTSMSHNLHNFSPGQEFLTPSKYKHASSIETNPSMNLPSFASNQYSAIELSESLGTLPSFYSPNKELGSFWMTPSNTLGRERSGLESDLRLKTESVLEVSEMQEVSPMKDSWQNSNMQSYQNSADRPYQYPTYPTFSPTKLLPINPHPNPSHNPQLSNFFSVLNKIRFLSHKSQQQQLHLNLLYSYNTHLTKCVQEKYQQVKQHKEYVETLITKKKQLQRKVSERKNQRKLRQKQMEKEIKEKIERLEREIDERDLQFDKDVRKFQYITREVEMVARLAEQRKLQEQYHMQHQHMANPYPYPYHYPILASKTYSSTKRLQPDLHYLSQPNTARSNLNQESNATFNFNNLNPEVHSSSQPKGSQPHEQGNTIMGLMQRALQGQFGQVANQQNGQNSGNVAPYFQKNPNTGYTQQFFQQHPNSGPSQPIFQQNPQPQPSLGQMLQRGLMQKLLQQQSSSSTVHINLQSSPSQSPKRQLPQQPSFSIHPNDHNHPHDHHRQHSQPSRLESSVLPYIEPPESTLSCSEFPEQIVIPSPTRSSPFGNLSPVEGKSVSKGIELALVRQLYRVQGQGQHQGHNLGLRSQLQDGEEKQLQLMINSISQSPTLNQHQTTQSAINIHAQSLQSSPQKRSIPPSNPPQIHSARGSNPAQHHKRISSGDLPNKLPQEILQSQVNINYQSSQQSDNLYRNHEFFTQQRTTGAYGQGWENPNRKRSPTHLEQRKAMQVENIRKTIDVPQVDALERKTPSEISKDNSDETPGFRSSCHDSDVRFSQPLIASFKNSQHMNTGLGCSQKFEELRQDIRQQANENQESSNHKNQTGRNTLSQSSIHVGTEFQPSLTNEFVSRHQLKIASSKIENKPTLPNNAQPAQPINSAQTHFISLPNELQSKYKSPTHIQQASTWPNQHQNPQNPPQNDDDDFFSCTLGTESVIDAGSRQRSSVMSNRQEKNEDKVKNFINEGKIKYTIDPSYDNEYDDEVFEDFGEEVRHTNQSVVMKSSKKQSSPSAKRYSLETPPGKVVMNGFQTVLQAQSDEQDQGKIIKTSRKKIPKLSKSTI